ncbi:MAG: hypothetical protein IKO57_11735 [Treponema sp.]|nr:hypothetical protein [Treponema sp.]
MLKRALSIVLASFILIFTNCDSWMKSDEFFGIIDEEVKYANAEKISVFVRYANTKEGTTNIDGTTTQKVEVPFTVSAVTSDAYGFYKWAAFSTSDYSTGRQHAILFNDEADYIDSFLPKEISSSIVTFDDPYSPETTVTINSARNDIFIIPIVAERPKIATSLPASGASNVVKNMAIRVVFSKKMDETTLLDTDESGNVVLSDKIDIYRTYGDFDNITLKSIKDIFTNVSLGATGKTLTIRLASGKTMPPNTSIRVIIDGEVKDAYGYEMGQESTILFTTGTASDSLSPTIQEIRGGFADSNSWGFNQNQVDSDPAYHVSSTNLDAFSTDDTDSISAKILAHRTTGLVNLWVYALDITETNSTPTEADVYQITLTATSLTNSSGNASEGAKEKEFFAYESGGNSSDVAMYDNTHGCQIAYDVSDLPDGLIRIDVGVTDTIGNDSFTPVCVDNSKGNYYKSIYVIKDTTKPDAESNFEKLKSDSADAPYGWYNATTIGTMEIYEEDDNLIIDNGNTKLVSLPENMKWIFKIGGDSSWKPSTSDSGWKIIKGNRYRIADASCDTDGPVDIQMRLMDDLGNISDAVHLESIMYDGTKPAIGTLSWTGDGELEGITQHNPLTTQTLSIPFTEVTSGVKFLELTSKKNGTTAAAKPLTGVTIALDGNVLAAGTDYTNDGNKITFTESKKSGTFTITGIKVTDATANTDGIYTIGVDLTDLALNKTATTSEISVSLDKTNPKVENVKIADLVERIVYNQTEKTYWISKEHFDTERNANKNKLEVTITENGSGIKKIELGGNAKVTSSSVIAIGTTEYAAGTDFEIDTESNAITLTNGYSPILRTDSGTLTFYITNVDFTNKNSAEGNTLNITLTDFVALEGNNAGKIKLESGSDITKVYVDSENPSVNLVTLTDRAQNTENNSVTSLYKKDAYTDERIVDISIKLTAESAANGAGVKAIKLTNATFGSETTATVDGNAFTAYEKDGDTVTFEKVFTGTEEITFYNVTITGTANGTQTIGATATDLIGWTSAETSDDICFDNVSPEIGTLQWTTQNDANAIAGITKDTILSTQVLNIPVTESTAGVKKLSINVTKGTTEMTTTPFASTSLSVRVNGTTLASSNYEIAGGESGSIVFKNPVKTGTISIAYLKIADVDEEGSYKLNVILLDAAENKDTISETSIEIAKDSTAPVIEKITIDDIRKRVLYGSGDTTYWLGMEAHNAAHEESLNTSDSNNASVPEYACMDIYITEESSGIQMITFGSDTILQSSTKVYLDGNLLSSSNDYSINTTSNTLNFTVTPTTQTSSNPVIMKKTEGQLHLRLENIKIKNYSSTTQDSCKNTISVKAQDFALNKSVEKTEISLDDATGTTIETVDTTAKQIYSSNRCNSIKTITLWDRGTDTGNDKTNKADADTNYTNEKYVNVIVEPYDTSYSARPGVNKVTLDSGASFVTDGTDKTTIAISTNGTSWTELDSSKYEFTDSKTCLFKVTFQMTTAYRIKFKNVELTGSENAINTVSANVHSVTGLSYSTNKSASITCDTTKPFWDGATATSGESGTGPFVAYFSSTGYYNESSPTGIHVYPHVTSATESSKGVILDSTEKSADGTQVRYFYTSATKYSYSSTYGVYLGIPANDNIRLWNSGKCVYDYKSTSSTSVSAEDVLKNGTNLTDNKNSATSSYYTDYSPWFWFDEGTHYAVIKDNAGNISPVYKFVVVKDTAVVEKATSGSTASDSGSVSFESLFEYSVGEDGYQIVCYDDDSGNQFNLYPTTNYPTYATKRAKIELKFNDGTNYSYSEAKNTKTQSGLYAYRFYLSSSLLSSTWTPTPTTSTTSTETTFASNDTTTTTGWIKFTEGKQAIAVYPPDNYSDKYYYYLQLQDNVGNVKNIQIRQSTSKNEIWQRDKDTISEFYTKNRTASSYGLRTNDTSTGIHSFSGEQDDPARNCKLGIMMSTSGKTFYNDNASLRVFIDQFTAKITTNSKILSGTNKGTTPAYTYRACLYASDSSSTPTKADVDTALGDTHWDMTATDANTKYGWSYLHTDAEKSLNTPKFTTGDSAGSYIIDSNSRKQLKVKYPIDDDTKDKYMFLVIEDYTGQFGAYGIGNYYMDGSTPKQTMKWRYDNTAPAITLKGEDTLPSDLSTEEELNTLVSQPGKRVFVSGTNAYVSNLRDSKTVTGTANWPHDTNSMGRNTFRSHYGTDITNTIGGLHSSAYRPYFNIDVKEDIGKIAAYCYTYGTATPPSLDSTSTDTIYNVTASKYLWYNGSYVSDYGVSAMIDTIKLRLGNSGTDATSDGPRTIYLHVMDTVGNVRTMKMGNVNWNVVGDNESTNKNVNESPLTADPLPEGDAARVLEPGEFYLKQDSTDGTMQTLNVAGTGNTYKDGADLEVKVPADWYRTFIKPSGTDAGIYGYSLTEGDVSTVDPVNDKDEDGNLFLRIPASKYKAWTSETNLKYYVYDKCGNYFTVDNCTALVDTTCPQLYMEFKGHSGSPIGKIYDAKKKISIDTNSSSTILAEGNIASSALSTSGKVFTNENTGEGSSSDNPYTIYSNALTSSTATTGSIAGIFKALDKNGTTTGEIAELKIKRYKIDGTTIGENIDSAGYYTSLTKTQIEQLSTDGVCTVSEQEIKLDDGGTDGKLYEISISDLASNTTTVYLAIRKDRTGPSFDTNEPAAVATTPTNVIGEKSNKLYYNTMNIEFTPNDSGIGSATYEIFGGTSGTTSLKTGTISADGTKVSVSTSDISGLGTDVLKVELTDKLGNSKAYSLKLNGTEVPTTKKWVNDTVKPVVKDFSKKTFYDYGKTIGSINGSKFYYNIISLWDKDLKKNVLYTTRSIDFELTPAGEDSTGVIKGYFISDSSSATADENTELASKVTLKPTDYIGETGKSGYAYVYAVDYAGNTSLAKTLEINESNFESKINTFASTPSYIEDNYTCYFNDETTITASISDSNNKITEYGFLYTTKQEPGDADWVYKDIYKSESGTTTATVSEKIRDYITVNEFYYLYFYIKNGVQDTYKYIGSSENIGYTWVYDNTPPTINAKLAENSSLATSSAVVAADTTIDSLTTGYYTKDGYTLSFEIADATGGCGLDTVTGATASDTTYTATSDASGAINVTATDKLGNKAEFKLSATVDKEGPVVSGITVTGAVKHENESILYVKTKESTATVTEVSATAEGVNSQNKYILTNSNSGLAANSAWQETALSITDFEGKTSDEVYIASIDILGNISYKKLSEIALKYGSEESDTITGAYTLVKDETPPAAPTTISVTEREGMILKAEEGEQPLIYFSATVFGEEATNAGLEATIAQAETDSDLKGFKVGEDGTVGSTVTIPLTFEEDATTKEVAIYAVDFAGNVSDAFTVKVVNDSEGPEIGTYTGEAPIKCCDGTDGKDYATNMITSGYSLSIPVTESTGTKVKYGYIINEADKNSPPASSGIAEWTEATIGEDGVTIEFQIPNIETIHQHLFFYVKDELGNESVTALGDPTKNWENWWLKYDASQGTSPSSSYTFDANSKKATITITNLSMYNPLKSISVSVTGTYTQTIVTGENDDGTQTTEEQTENVTRTATIKSMNIGGSLPYKSENLPTSEEFQTPYIVTTLTLEAENLSSVTDCKVNIKLQSGTVPEITAPQAFITRTGIPTLTSFFDNSTKKSSKKATRMVTFDEVFAKRYQTSSATSAVKTATNVASKTADAVAKAVAKDETSEARTVDFSSYKNEIARHLSSATTSESANVTKRKAQSSNVKLTKEKEKKLMQKSAETVEQTAENATGSANATAENADAAEKTQLTQVQVQILKILLAMFIASVVVGAVFAIKKRFQNEKNAETRI